MLLQLLLLPNSMLIVLPFSLNHCFCCLLHEYCFLLHFFFVRFCLLLSLFSIKMVVCCRFVTVGLFFIIVVCCCVTKSIENNQLRKSMQQLHKQLATKENNTTTRKTTFDGKQCRATKSNCKKWSKTTQHQKLWQISQFVCI